MAHFEFTQLQTLVRSNGYLLHLYSIVFKLLSPATESVAQHQCQLINFHKQKGLGLF